MTNYDVHLWGDELFSYALQKGYSVLREKAPINQSLLETIRKIPKSFKVALHIVATGNLESLLRTRERYEKEVLEKKIAKLSNIEAHNICYTFMPEFILKCMSLKVDVNLVLVKNGTYKTIPIKNLEMLRKIREKSNQEALFQYEKRIQNIKESMTKRNAQKDEWEELKKIENIYLEIKKSFVL